MTKKLFFGVALLLQLINVAGQKTTNFPNVTIPTPEVAAFAKNVDIPMSYSSGTPPIAIPLYSVKSGSIEIPVSLSYNGSGIRVEEASTWVGLGWNLSAGASLARSIRGIADDKAFGYMFSPNNRKVKYVNALPHLSSERQGIELQELQANQVDLEPDIFSFSVPGYSGQFYWNQDSSKFVLSPFQNIIIQHFLGANGIESFKLTTGNGISYSFGGGNGCNCIESLQWSSTTSVINGEAQAPTLDNTLPNTTSWAIKQIEDPSGKIIEYSYTMDFNVREFGRGGETKGVSISNPNNESRASFFKQDFNKPVLEMISGDNCNIYFKRSSLIRQDVANQGKTLDSIEIRTKNGIEIRTFLLNYNYAISHDSIVLPGIEEFTGISRKRLFLKTITEKNISSSIGVPPYEFFYSDVQLPNRLSAAQDYWGYFNGKNNGNFLMPRIPLKSRTPGVSNSEMTTGYIPGADRRIDTGFAKAGMLNQIKYPTGGVTTYTYEQNNSVANLYFKGETGIERPDVFENTFTFMPLLYAEGTNPHYFMDTFRLIQPQSAVKITPNLPYPCDPVYSSSSCLYTIKIKSLPDSSYTQVINTNAVVYAQLPKSLYKIEAFVAGPEGDPVTSFTVKLDWLDVSDPANFLIGGLRAKKIVSMDGSGKTISRSYTYDFNDSTGYSSGSLVGLPTHLVNEYDSFGQAIRFYYVSNSSIPLTADGQTVRYSFVTEYLDSLQSSYKTQYSYLSDLPSVSFGAQDNAPPLLKGWKNNLLFRKLTYEKAGHTYRELTDEKSYYSSFKEMEHLYGLHGNQLRPYNVATEWYVMTSSENITYAYQQEQQNSLQTVVQKKYNDQFLLSSSRTSSSQGKTIDNKYWYPNDYDNISGFNLDQLKTKNLISLPIKQETSIGGKIISGTISKFNSNGQAIELYAYENNLVIDTVQHVRTTILEPSYVLKSRVSYDINSNLLQMTPVNNMPSVYIWDYQVKGFTGAIINSKPIAVIQNADTSTVAYTSFENAGKGNWVFTGVPSSDVNAVTGKNVYLLNAGSISKNGLSSSGAYIVSYWSNNQQTVSNTVGITIGKTYNGWTYFEHKVNNPASGIINITGTGSIDELRLYPEKGQMITYAYNNLFDLNAINDVNNQITYYVYDGLGRLSLVKDQDKNILKKYCYNYAGQLEDCGLDKSPKWQSTNVTRCKPCPANSNYISNIQQHQEKDNNPYSTTYNTLRWIDDGVSSSCVPQADWQLQSVSCQLNTAGQNTGTQVRTERDMNPCSSTYNTTRQVTVYNTTTCPLPVICSTSNCSGVDRKCVNGVCEVGCRVNTSSVYTKINNPAGDPPQIWVWRCTYHYVWSDGSVSPNYTEDNQTSCSTTNNCLNPI